jgi:hypothetical protein
MVRGLTSRTAASIAVALPAVCAAVAALTACLLALVGENPLWGSTPLNMAEAAALRDRATVLQLIRAGQDPDARYPVRAGMLSARASSLTPLEAAVAADRPEVVEIWLWARGGVDEGVWTRAKCLARAAESDDIERVVDQYRPADLAADAPLMCGPERP